MICKSYKDVFKQRLNQGSLSVKTGREFFAFPDQMKGGVIRFLSYGEKVKEAAESKEGGERLEKERKKSSCGGAERGYDECLLCTGRSS